MGAPDEASESASYVGRSFGEFIVREPLSSGGFGLVFRAEQPLLGREAVIKVLHARLRGSEAVVQRFLREARLASQLDHPYAAHTYAFGAEPDGVLWIAMELVRGTPLDKLLEANGPLPLERFVPLFERLCEVVHTAHEQGIVHRDLKPANVMVLSRAGRLLPKLLDLGIARGGGAATAGGERARTGPVPAAAAPDGAPGALDETAVGAAAAITAETMAAADAPATPRRTSAVGDSLGDERLTQHGAIMGSPLYMAPEQWADAGAADARSDLYALGVLAFEALTGTPPFSAATTAKLAQAHATAPPPPLGPGFPPALDAVIARALAKRPADRPATALELAAALRSASGIAAEPVSLPRLDDALRARVLLAAPRPLALSVAALDAARNAHQARDALWLVGRVAVRLVALVALAAHAHVGSSTLDPLLAEALRRLRAGTQSDADWLALARALCQPFARLREAHPVPELVELLSAPSGPLDTVVALGAAGADRGGSEDQVRERVTDSVAAIAAALEALAFLDDYPLVVVGPRGAERWMGLPGPARSLVPLSGPPLSPGQPALLDAGGVPVVSLWPFVQALAPAPGAPEALFLLDGKGKRGARLVALPDGFEHDDDAAWEALGGLLADDAEQAAAATGEQGNPFPGLATFTAADADHFFGRERQTEAMVNRLRGEPLVAVVGPSGAGKSSFVQAGVVPALPAGWTAITLRPGPAPLVSLAARLALAGIEVGDLGRELGEHPGALGTILRAHGASRHQVLVIVVDQLEELFTLCDDPAERDRFADALSRAARSADDPVRLVVTLRDDFLIRAEGLPGIGPRLSHSLQLLSTPPPADLRRILVEPVRRAGYEFDDRTLPDAIVAEVAGLPGALPLLSFTASQLWERRDRRFRQLGKKAYDSLGGVGGALAQHAEATLEALPPDEQRLVRHAFRHLVTAEGTRAVLSRGELEELLGGARAGDVLEKLIAARLVTSSESETGGERIEVVHEALLEAWPRLVRWRREDAEGARLRDQLRAAARQWVERGRPRGLLWRDDALAEYRQWRPRQPGPLTAAEEEFAATSMADADRGRRRRTAVISTVVAMLAVGVVALLLQNRRVAEQRSLAEAASAEAEREKDAYRTLLRSQYEDQGRRLVLGDDPLQALAYLAKAAELGASGPAHDFLVAWAVRATDGELFRFKHDGAVVHVQYSADGSRLVSSSYDGTAQIRDARDGQLLFVARHKGPVLRSALSRDGKRAVTASSDGTAALWDVASARRVAVLPLPSPLWLAAFTPDEQFVLTITTDDRVDLWEATSGAHRRTLQPASAAIEPARRVHAFAPGGLEVAVADHQGAIRAWRLAGGPARLLGDLAAPVTALEYAPAGDLILAAATSGEACLFDVRHGRRIRCVRHSEALTDATFVADGARFATTSGDRTAALWSTASGDQVARLRGHRASVNDAVLLGGKVLATVSDDGALRLWNPHSGVRVGSRLGHSSALRAVGGTADGAQVAAGGVGGTVVAWTGTPNELVVRIEASSKPLRWIEFSPDGKRLVSTGDDGMIRLWDLDEGTLVRAWSVGRPLGRVRFSPNGELIAVTSRLAPSIYSVSGELLREWTGVGGQDVSWDPTGQLVVSADLDGHLRFREVYSGALRLEVDAHRGRRVWAVSYLDGDAVVSVGADGRFLVTNPATGNAIWQGDDPDQAYTLAVDRTGRQVVSAVMDQTARIGSPLQPERQVLLHGHVGPVFDARWSHDSAMVVTASGDGAVHLWDSGGGSLLARFEPGAIPTSAALAPDGAMLAVATLSGTIVLWSLPNTAVPPEMLAQVVRCRLPFSLIGEQLVSRPISRGCR
jgi:WD40 repeat protein/serine/threonine protein kinase